MISDNCTEQKIWKIFHSKMADQAQIFTLLLLTKSIKMKEDTYK